MVSTIHSDFGDIHMVPSLVARKAVSSKEEAFPSPAWCSRSHDRKQPSKKYPVQPMCWNLCERGVTAHQGAAGKSHDHGPKMVLLQSPA